MSYFKTRTTETSNNNNAIETNSSFTRNTFISSSVSEKPIIYNYQTELFPELTTNTKSKDTVETNCNYANAAATTSKNVVSKKTYEIPANKTEYTFNKTTGKTTVAYGKKSNSELERDNQIQLESEPNYIAETIIKELSYNWKKYKREYGQIHGKDAYDNMFYTEPIYPISDEEYGDLERDAGYYSY